MPAHLTPEESAALLPAGTESAARVTPRDFRQPRRLSREARERLKRKAGIGLRGAEQRWREWLGCALSIELVDAGEIVADVLFDGLEEPFVVLELSSDHGPGWLVWDNACAKAIVEVALGSDPNSENFQPASARQPQALSPVESGLAIDLFGIFFSALSEALGIQVGLAGLHQGLRDLRAAVDRQETSDPRCLFLHVEVGAPRIEGTLRVYLPGALVGIESSEKRKSLPPELPNHLDPVPVEISATLGAIDVPLAELLAIEVGDIIPLGVAADAPAQLHVEEQVFGQARWGAHNGRLALQILEVEPLEEDE